MADKGQIPIIKIEDAIDDYQVTLRVLPLVDGSFRCVELSVWSLAGVTGNSLRKIPVRKMLAKARQSGALDGQAGFETRAILDHFGIRESKPGRGRPLSDEHLQGVAKTYRLALQKGHNPIGFVARVGRVPRPTASGWISKARQRGLLGATRPGVAGEIGG